MAAQTRVTNGGDLLGSAPRPQPGSAPRGRLGRLGPVIVVVLIALVWGVAFSVVKGTVSSVTPGDLVTWRFVVAAAALLLARPRSLRGVRLETVLRGCALGTILGAGFLIHTWGMRSTSVVVSAFVTGTAVVFAPLAAWLWLGRTPTRRTAAAITLATVGLAVITVPGAGFGSGGALIAVAAVLWAVHLVALEAWSRPGEVYALAVIQVGTVALLAALVQTVAGAGLTLPDRPSTWLALVGLGAIATGGAFVALTWAQTRMDATTAAVVLTLEPVFGAAAALALGETLTLPSTIGAAAVITATFLVVKRTGPTISAEAGE